MIRIALRSDRRLFADVLTTCLETRPGYTVVGSVARLDELPRLCELRHPDLVLVHLSSGLGADPDDALARMRACVAASRVVVLYDRLTTTELCDLWQLGVENLVPCSRGMDALCLVLGQGGRAGHPATAAHVRNLTELEERVLGQLGAGRTVAQIARLLEISPSRVANTKRVVYRKLGVVSQSQAVARAVALGIVARPHPQVRAEPRGAARQVDGALAVELRGPQGVLRERVAGALHASGIPLLVGAPLLVLVDPTTDDWPDHGDATAPVALVLSAEPRRAEVLEALLRGVITVVTADQLADLAPALLLSTHGFVTLDADATAALLDAIRAPSIPAQRLPELTSREGDILRSIADGHTVRRTARVLGIAEKTVENTQARLFRKLGARNRPGALAAAHALGLMELSQRPP